MREELINKLKVCELCPRKCKIDRTQNKVGFCGATADIKIALADLHYYEEPCISGEEGSGAVFFSGCNLNCVFCQNFEISQCKKGKIISIEELAEEFLKLQERHANNINLVTGFMYVPQIIEALDIAKEKGLVIPVVYNSSGYESVETLRLLEGYVDVYLPDFKYFDNELAKKLSGIDNYFENCVDTINEMYRQVGSPEFDDNGIIRKGLIIRHLVLPNHLDNTFKVLKWIKENIDNEVYTSVMAQYFPSNKALNTNDINRKLNEDEYEIIENYVFDLDLNGYIQDLEDNEEQYVPNFDI